ncbi:MAG: rod shape-determining protein MreC [Phycisphaerales bacterium]
MFTRSRAYLISVIVLLITTLTPVPFGEWLDGLALQLVTPLSEPLTRLSTTLRPVASELDELDPDVARLRVELEQARSRIANLEDLSARLLRQLEEFQQGYAADAQHHFRLVRARRSGRTAVGQGRSFRVNAGRRHGVEIGVAATYDIYHLVGRVTEVDMLTSVVTPITDPGDDAVLEVAVLFAGSSIETGAIGALRPDDEGRLRGFFSREFPIAVGDRVRLRDDSWGELYTGLVVGSVVEVNPSDEFPLRNEIVVEPDIPVSRVASVMLKIPAEARP